MESKTSCASPVEKCRSWTLISDTRREHETAGKTPASKALTTPQDQREERFRQGVGA
jgi:hypothetical protein